MFIKYLWYNILMITALILAAGSSKRFGENKLFFKINKKQTVIEKVVSTFLKSKKISEIILVVNKNDQKKIDNLEIIKKNNIKTILGGQTRFDSSKKGLEKVTSEKVLIHDAARCFISSDKLDEICSFLLKKNNVVPFININDTIKSVKNNSILDHLNRENFVKIQTPQGFITKKILEAYKKTKFNEKIHTDDSAVFGQYYKTKKINLIMGSVDNIKLTTKKDKI